MTRFLLKTAVALAVLTGSAAEVTPVSEIAQYRFTPAAMTKTLMDDYTAEVQPKAKAARNNAA